uniref:Uncharacterized protein n=1 Tax=Arundo donax TaxID=35708 RepID=A0A0A9B2C2_ARUDO
MNNYYTVSPKLQWCSSGYSGSLRS